MASRIKLKRSLTPNSVPTTSDLTDKEVALNINDRTLYVNNNGTIVEVLNADPNDEKIVPSMFSSAITDGVGNTWYVSTNGTDKATLGSVNPRHSETTGANAWGKTPTTAFASLKYALDNYAQSGDTIVVATGTYTEVFPLTVPVGVVIKGEGLKSTFIQPTSGTNTEDAFLIEGDCNIEDLCVTGFYYDGVGDTGYAFRLKSTYSVAADGRRPYIQRCSVITQGSATSGADPRGYAAGDAGRGALVDGSGVDATSAEAALLFNECTFVVPNAVGLYLKNGARCEWLNSFTYFAADSIKGENPGGTGFKGTGKTRLKLNSTTGTFNSTDTITYYDVDGVTALASGTIDSNDGTYIYIDGQGTGTFVEAEAQTTGKAITVNGDAQLDTDEKKFGTASLLLDGTGDYLNLAGSSDFGFGTGDFTVEAFIRPSSVASGTKVIADFRSTSGTVAGLLVLSGSTIEFQSANGAGTITGSTNLSANVFYHFAVVRESGVTKLYLNGSQEGSNLSDTTDYGSSRALYIGANFNGTSEFPGHIDEFRVSKGLARYTGAFTPTTSEFVSDTNTQLLLHLNGLDGATSILDGSVSSQDIRSSSGGTAQYIALADYTDFGAELRSIGSASVYGERGITADGKGVRLRCIVHNFGYIGTGADGTNDISNVNQANEIVEANGGRALFTSMDQNGDFRVGNAFFVDQENGTVSFVGGTQGGGTTFDQLVVTGTGDTTTILPTSISVGNLQFSGSLLESAVSGLTLNSTDWTRIESNRLLIEDGTVSQPSLSFWADQDTGLYRGTDGNLKIVSDGSTVASYEPSRMKVSKNIEFDANQIDGISVTNGGNYYPYIYSGGQAETVYTVPLTGGSGTEGQIAVTVEPFEASVTTPGTYSSIGTFTVNFTGGNGTNGTGNVTIRGIQGGTISNGGAGYGSASLGITSDTYQNVTVTGGNGNGAIATVVVTGGSISQVTFSDHGNGYQAGDVLGFDHTTMQGIDINSGNPYTSDAPSSAATYVVPANPYGAESLVPIDTWAGYDYIVGDVIGITGGGLAGVGGATFTLNKIQFIDSATITTQQTGFAYENGDITTPSISLGSAEDVNGVIEKIELTVNSVDKDYVVVSGVTGTLTVGNTITYSGGATATIEAICDTQVYTSTPSQAVSASETFTTSGGAAGTVDSVNNGLVFEIEDPEDNVVKLLPNLTLKPNRVYEFVQGEIDFNTYQILFSTTPGGVHNGGTQYTTLWRNLTEGTRFGSQLVVTTSTPTLYYYMLTVPYGGGPVTASKALTVSTATADVPTGAQFAVTSTTAGSQSITIEPRGDITSTGLTTLNDLTVTGTANIPQIVVSAETTFGGAQTTINSTDTTITSDVNINDGTFVVHNPENKVSFKSTDVPTRDVYFNSTVETELSTYLSSDDASITVVGSISDPAEKLEVSDNARVRGKVILSDGAINEPSLTFNTDNKIGLLLKEEDNENALMINNNTGAVVKYRSSDIRHLRDTKFVHSTITDTSILSGYGYTPGDYQDIELLGGSGGGIVADITIAFGTTITEVGAGYDDSEEYNDVPVSYVTLPGGAIQSFTNLVGGSNYVNGTYTAVPLTGGSGVSATADLTVTGGVVTSAVINRKGSDYSAGNVLSADIADFGGSFINTVSIVNGGQDYQEGVYAGVPLVNISSAVPGSDAEGTFTVNSSGAISGITITNTGKNYTQGDSFTVAINTAGTQTFTVTQPGGPGTTLEFNGVDRTTDGIELIQGNVYTFDNTSTGTAMVISSSTSNGNALEAADGCVYTLDGSDVTSSAYISGYAAATTRTITYTIGATYIGTDPVTTHYYFEQNTSSTGGTFSYATQNTGTGLIASVGSVTTGSGFEVEVATVGTVAAGEAGSGALAKVVVTNGEVEKLYITTAGTGYNEGHLLTIADADMQYTDEFGDTQTSAAPTTQLAFTAGRPGGVSFVEITNSGFGYQADDELRFNTNVPVTSPFYNATAGVFDVSSFFASTVDSPTSLTLNETGFLAILDTDRNPSPATTGNFPGEVNTNTISDSPTTQTFIIKFGQNTTASSPVNRYANEPIAYFANGTPLYSPSVGDTITDEDSNGASTFTVTGLNWNSVSANVSSAFEMDAAGGYPTFTGLYQYTVPKFIGSGNWATVVTNNTYYSSTNFSGDNLRSTNGHSKIIGIAHDGYPIYGPFGFTNTSDPNSGITRQTSSYRTKTTDTHRPNNYKYTDSIQTADPTGTTFLNLTAGTFIEDFEYVNGLGTIDQFNGKYTVTPEYPEGTYAYFVTIDGDDVSTANHVYPYVIGDQFKETPVQNGTSPADPNPTGTNGQTIDVSTFVLTLDGVTVEDTITLSEATGNIEFKAGKIEGTLNFNDALNINNATITVPSGNMNLTATTGFVVVTGTGGLTVPGGTLLQRPGGPPPGTIRFNTDDSLFEGYNGSEFISLGGVRDVDGDTFITAELNPGDDDDTFRFYTTDNLALSFTETTFTYDAVRNLRSTNLNGVALWEAGATAESPFAEVLFDPQLTSNAGSVDATANTITLTGHLLTEGVEVVYDANPLGEATVDLIQPLSSGSTYYVHVVDENTIQLAASESDLLSSTFINITGGSTNTLQSFTPVAESVTGDQVFVYYGENVYRVDSNGTFDADPLVPPTHTTGTVTNGTVDLTYIRNIYSNLGFRGTDFSFNVDTAVSVNGGAISFSGDTADAFLTSGATNLNLNIGTDTLVKVSQTGSNSTTGGISVNTEYATGNPANYVQVLDRTLTKFDLKDTRVFSAVFGIDTSTGSSGSATCFPYTESFSGKFMVEIVDDTASQNRQYSEISYLIRSDGSDIFYTENNKIYTSSTPLCDTEVDLSSGNIVITVTDLTGSATTVYSVKVVSQAILT